MTGNQLAPLDLLIGCAAIGNHLGLGPNQVAHLARTGALPTIRVGRKIAVRASRLTEWIASQEAAAEIKADRA